MGGLRRRDLRNTSDDGSATGTLREGGLVEISLDGDVDMKLWTVTPAVSYRLFDRATTAFTDLRLRIQKGEKKWQKLYVAIPQHLREVAGG